MGRGGAEVRISCLLLDRSFVGYFASLNSPSIERKGKGSGISSDTVQFPFFVPSIDTISCFRVIRIKKKKNRGRKDSSIVLMIMDVYSFIWVERQNLHTLPFLW